MNFCTLFDSNFLTYGLALYDSLMLNAAGFKLYVVAFDDECFDFLIAQNLPDMVVISLADFEDDKLLTVKGGRSKGEYCWTCTSSVIKYCIEQFKLDHCIYLDSDLFFYQNPGILLKDIGDNSVLITPHWYSKKVDTSALTGKYCVQFVYFKNDENGMKVLNWWRDACIDWCFNRIEDGKFGDQKYLDNWQTQFEGVYVLQNRGGGVAPWNVADYEFDASAALTFKYLNTSYDIVFFHFHGLRTYTDETNNRIVNLGNYKLAPIIKQKFYVDYLKRLEGKYQLLNKLKFENKIINSFVFRKTFTLKERIYNAISGVNNVHKLDKFIK